METTTATETILDTFGARKLIALTCQCGTDVTLCLLDTDARLCLDCRDDASRNAHGWTPENSLS